jgi:electron transfer flavoprotein beta subunit
MASDTNAGQVGCGLAEILGIPAITIARKIVVEGGTACIERVLADGCEVVESTLPCLVTVSHELGEMRAASVKGLMAAQKQPLTIWRADDLGVVLSSPGRNRALRLFIPERTGVCEFVEGGSPEEAGAALALKMKEFLDYK